MDASIHLFTEYGLLEPLRNGATMAGRIPMRGGDEFDVFGVWRRLYFWQRGEMKRIKRAYNKRARKAGKRDANDV